MLLKVKKYSLQAVTHHFSLYDLKIKHMFDLSGIYKYLCVLTNQKLSPNYYFLKIAFPIHLTK